MAFRTIRVTATLECGGNRIVRRFSNSNACETGMSIRVSTHVTEDMVEVFLVHTCKVIFPLIKNAFVVKILICKVQLRNTMYDEELHGQNREKELSG